MIRYAQSQISKVIGLTIGIFALCGATALTGQEKISPVSDYQYKKDYAQYEGIKKEADPQKRADLLLAFMKEHPISRMLFYVASDYLESVKPHMMKKDWAKALSMEEAFLALMPTEKTVQAAAVPEPGASDFLKNQLLPTQKTIYQALLAAYFQSNNMPKAAEMGERLYSLVPDKSIASALADIYLRMQNTDKFMVYAAKILAEFPMEQAFSTALQMAQVYLQKQDVNKARELYIKVMDVYGEKTPPGVQEPVWNATRAVAYGVIAANVYGQKDYPKAIELYQKVANFDPKRDDAHYFIGMCKWNSKDPEGAIEAFAKAAVLGKTNAKKAQDYLEQLYKARHNDKLDGLDQVLAKAKADLGIK